MYDLTMLPIDLINNHGKYSTVSNNCQTFAMGFKLACLHPKENIKRTRYATQTDTSITAGSFVYASGVVIGSLGIVFSPMTLGVSQVIGCAIGFGIQIVSIPVKKNQVGNKANDNKYENVALKGDCKRKDKMDKKVLTENINTLAFAISKWYKQNEYTNKNLNINKRNVL